MQFCGGVFVEPTTGVSNRDNYEYLRNANVDFLKSVTIIDFLSCIKEAILLDAEVETFTMSLLMSLAKQMKHCVSMCLASADSADFHRDLYREKLAPNSAIHCIGVAISILHGLSQLSLPDYWSPVLELFGEVCDFALVDTALRKFFQISSSEEQSRFTAESGHKVVNVTKIYENRISFTPVIDPHAKLHYLPRDRRISCGVVVVPSSLDICSREPPHVLSEVSQTETWIHTALCFVVYHRAVRKIADDYFGTNLDLAERAIFKEVLHYHMIKASWSGWDFRQIVLHLARSLQHSEPGSLGYHVYSTLSTIHGIDLAKIRIAAQSIEQKLQHQTGINGR
jgi:hypothetical protein